MTRIIGNSPLGQAWENHISTLANLQTPFCSSTTSELELHSVHEAQGWLRDIGSVDWDVLRVNPAAQQARPWGAFPDEIPAEPFSKRAGKSNVYNVLLDCWAGRSLDSTENIDTTRTIIQKSFEELTRLVTHPSLTDEDGNQLSAQLHTFLPREDAISRMSRLAFSYAELAETQDEQERALSFLDTLSDELGMESAGFRIDHLRVLMNVYMGRALSRLDNVWRSVEHYEAAIKGVADLRGPAARNLLLGAYTGIIGERFKLAIEQLERKDMKEFEKQVELIVRHLKAAESKILEYPVEFGREILLNMRAVVARHFWYWGLFNESYKVLHDIQEKYGNSEGRRVLENILNGYGNDKNAVQDLNWFQRLLHHFRNGKGFSPDTIKNILKHVTNPDGTLKAPSEIKDARWWRRLKPALKFARWKRPSHAILSSLAGAIGFGCAYYCAKNGNASGPEVAQAAAVGALAVSGGLRVVTGARDPRAKGHAALGVNTLSGADLVRNGLRTLAPALIPYVALGGSVPGLGAIADLPILTSFLEATPNSAMSAGALQDPGTLVGNAASFSGQFVMGIGNLFLNYDASGLQQVLTDVRQSTFVSTIESGIYGHKDIFVSSIGDGRMWERIHSTGLTRNAWMMSLGALEAASLATVFAWRFNDNIKDWVNDTPVGKNVGRYLILPLGILGTAHIAVMLGAKPGYNWFGLGDLFPVTIPWKMLTAAWISASFQGFDQVLNGAKPENIQPANLVNKALLRAGSAAMAVQFVPYFPSESVLDKMVEGSAKYVAILPMLTLYGWLSMAGWKRYFQAKFISAALFKPVQYGASMMVAPFDHPLAFAIRGVLELLMKPWQQRTYNENAGIKPTQKSFKNNVRDATAIAEGAAKPNIKEMIRQLMHNLLRRQASEGSGQSSQEMALEELMVFFNRALFRLPWDAPVRRWEWSSALVPYYAFKYAFNDQRIPGRLIPEEKNFALLYRMMLGNDFSRREMEQLLWTFAKFAHRKENADMARGFAYIVAAARHGNHGQLIEQFTFKYRETFRKLGVDRNAEPLSENIGRQEQEIFRFIMERRRSKLNHPMPQIPSDFKTRHFVKSVGGPHQFPLSQSSSDLVAIDGKNGEKGDRGISQRRGI